MITSIDHIELVVRDVEEEVGFLEKLGFRVVRRTPHRGGSVELQLPGPHQPIVEIHKVREGEAIGMNHLGLGVDDISKTQAELEAKGLPFNGEPRLIVDTQRMLSNTVDPNGWDVQLVGKPS
ncbi:MAG: VOC family protein [Bacteroidetes bacterium]|nr:VOC family protein [Bacteroidota bacterium]MCL5026917.1 VOC family protein [Chloroflexota bacterium]